VQLGCHDGIVYLTPTYGSDFRTPFDVCDASVISSDEKLRMQDGLEPIWSHHAAGMACSEGLETLTVDGAHD